MADKQTNFFAAIYVESASIPLWGNKRLLGKFLRNIFSLTTTIYQVLAQQLTVGKRYSTPRFNELFFTQAADITFLEVR